MYICVNLYVLLRAGLHVHEYTHNVCFLTSNTETCIKTLLFNANV
jgi:hypothetical protein